MGGSILKNYTFFVGQMFYAKFVENSVFIQKQYPGTLWIKPSSPTSIFTVKGFYYPAIYGEFCTNTKLLTYPQALLQLLY